MRFLLLCVASLAIACVGVSCAVKDDYRLHHGHTIPEMLKDDQNFLNAILRPNLNEEGGILRAGEIPMSEEAQKEFYENVALKQQEAKNHAKAQQQSKSTKKPADL